MFDDLKDGFEWLIDQFWDGLVALFEGLLSIIPVPEFVDQARNYFLSAASALEYPMYVMGIDVGVPMVFGAWLIRFIIRRLPIVG
ncbi:hypothetical protein [Oceanobacter mangrovi]|uniref:hypothetical protein n=1 Tax=Oceanobacter mangrovi TaxID=2862510 RepID=UPI001C8D3D3A|nr:hypothetical protein [Oceanobacter mangrovi]